MKPIRSLVIAAIALSFVAVPPPEVSAQNGVVLQAVATEYHNRGDRTLRDIEVSVLDDMIRFDIVGEENSVIFRGDDETVYFIDHRRERYSSINREMISDVMESVGTILEELGDLAIQLNPDDTDEIERALEVLQAMEEGGEPMEPTRGAAFRELGESATFGAYDCELYEHEESRESTRVCIADADRLDGGDQIIDAFTGFVDFFDGFIAPLRGLEEFAEDEDEWMSTVSDFRGFMADGLFPVGFEHFDRSGDLEERTEVMSVERRALTESDFEAPDGYRSEGVMGMDGMNRMNRGMERMNRLSRISRLFRN